MSGIVSVYALFADDAAAGRIAHAMIAAIAAARSHAIPAIVAWPVAAGHGPYLDWITATAAFKVS